MDTKSEKELEIVKEGVCKHVPKLAEFIGLETSLLDYSRKLYEVDVEDKYLERQNGLKRDIRAQAKLLFGNEVERFDLHIDGPIIANIVDHNGIVNHPVLMGSHIVSSAAQLFDRKFDILSLNTGLYPFNSVFYDGGLTWQGERHRFVSNSKSHQLVYYASPVDFSRFPKEARAVLESADQPASEMAWQQAGRMNYQLWPQLFEENLREQLPSLVTLNHDVMIINLISELIEAEDNFIYDVIIDKEQRVRCHDVFTGTTGAWDEAKHKGSFLFWAVDENNRGVGLKLVGDNLVSVHEGFTYEVEITKPAILKALAQNKIYPGMMLIYGAMVFYAGLVPLAGYGSINYINVMQQRWLELLHKEYANERASIEKMVFNRLIGGPVLTYYRDDAGSLQQAYMLDVLLLGGLTKNYLEKIFSMSVGDLLLAPLIDIYNTYIPEEHREAISITSEDVVSEQLSWI